MFFTYFAALFSGSTIGGELLGAELLGAEPGCGGGFATTIQTFAISFLFLYIYNERGERFLNDF